MLPVYLTKRMGSPLATRWGFDPMRALDRAFGGVEDDLCVDVDVREDAGFYYVDADVPGFERDNIDVTFENGLLTLSGERKSEETREGENYHITERRVGRFSRSFKIDAGVNEDSVEASLKDGVLTIKLAKSDDVKPRRIEVKGS